MIASLVFGDDRSAISHVGHSYGERMLTELTVDYVSHGGTAICDYIHFLSRHQASLLGTCKALELEAEPVLYRNTLNLRNEGDIQTLEEGLQLWP